MIEDWKTLIAKAKIPKVISQMLERLENLEDQDYSHQMIMISSRQEGLKKKLANELISEENGRISQNKIKASILMLIEELEDDGVVLTEDNNEQLQSPEEHPEPIPNEAPLNLNIPLEEPQVIDPPTNESKNDTQVDTSGLVKEIPTQQEAPVINLDQLKKQASLKLRELKSLRKEETFTLPGANLFKIQLNIEELEKEMAALKDQIRSFHDHPTS